MLTSKQRAYLRSLANSEAPILHAGKGGVSDTMRRQADDALTARELIKGRAILQRPGSGRGSGRLGRGRCGAGGGPQFRAVPAEPQGTQDPPSPLE